MCVHFIDRTVHIYAGICLHTYNIDPEGGHVLRMKYAYLQHTTDFRRQPYRCVYIYVHREEPPEPGSIEKQVIHASFKVYSGKHVPATFTELRCCGALIIINCRRGWAAAEKLFVILNVYFRANREL